MSGPTQSTEAQRDLNAVKTAEVSLKVVKRQLERQIVEYADNAGHLPTEPKVRKKMNLLSAALDVAQTQAEAGRTTPIAIAFRRWERVVSTGATLSGYRMDLEAGGAH